jgi:molybdenum cofactor cytidylyltransferase
MASGSGRAAALILAAGRSTRMGRPKLALPWKGDRTIIAQVVATFKAGGAEPIVVVTGGHRIAVEAALKGEAVITVHNERFVQGGMLRSIKVGLRALAEREARAVLICPGDLPVLEVDTVSALIRAWEGGEGALIAPSYRMQRGHPVLIGRAYWEEIQELPVGSSLRAFLGEHEGRIAYVVVEDPGIRRDLDTPEDFRRVRGEAEE